MNIKIQQDTRHVILLNANKSVAQTDNEDAPKGQTNSKVPLGETKETFNFSTTIFAVQQNKIRNYKCQTPLGLQNILNLKALYNNSESI